MLVGFTSEFTGFSKESVTFQIHVQDFKINWFHVILVISKISLSTLPKSQFPTFFGFLHATKKILYVILSPYPWFSLRKYKILKWQARFCLGGKLGWGYPQGYWTSSRNLAINFNCELDWMSLLSWFSCHHVI